MSERLRVTGGTDSVRWCAENSAPDVWPAGEIMMKRLICWMVGLVLNYNDEVLVFLKE
ncbi:MAG: hypothetical protein VX877_01855 [Planctomycetota bacterium]|nr:hypothetical protein [Planctomycetota bacterium]